MARIKTTLAVSVLAHALALASMAVVMPNPEKLLDRELTAIELVDFRQAAEKVQSAVIPLKKAEQTEKKIEAAKPEPKQIVEKVEESRQDIRPEPVNPVPVTVAVQKAAFVEPQPPHRHMETPAPVAEAALKAQGEAGPAKAGLNNDAAFNSYVIRKIDRAKLYPNWARQRGYEGNVMVSFKLSPDGSVSDIKVVGPCECDVLNKAACEAIKRAAPFNDGPAVESRARDMKVNIGFKLQK